jgi:tetratricopeptide (TPR) repeat protein
MMPSRFSLSVLALTFLSAPAFAAPHPLPAKAPANVVYGPADYMQQAEAAKAKGDMDLAIRLAQAAIVADPAKPQSYDLLGDFYAGEGQSDFARFYYNEALGIDPSDGPAGRGIAGLDHGGAEQAAEAATPGK